jgi:hypothetical protein
VKRQYDKNEGRPAFEAERPCFRGLERREIERGCCFGKDRGFSFPSAFYDFIIVPFFEQTMAALKTIRNVFVNSLFLFSFGIFHKPPQLSLRFSHEGDIL